MHTIYNKMICFVTAFLMIVSGVYVDVDYVDSVFTHSRYATSECMEEVAFALVQDDYLSAETQVQEIRAIQESSNVYTTIRNGSRRNDTRWSVDIIFASLCLQDLFHFQKTVEAFSFQESLCGTVILNYIHKQDGKK